MVSIVGTGNVVERVLQGIYTIEELKDLEQLPEYELFELVIVYGGMEYYDEAVADIFGVKIETDMDKVMQKISIV